MKKLFFTMLVLVFSVHYVGAQISTPEKNKGNIGFYFGANPRLMKPIVSIDFSYKFATLRVMPLGTYNALGATFEITKLSTTFYNLYWIAGANAGVGTDEGRYDAGPSEPPVKTEYNTLTAFTGLRTYFGKRWYTNIVAGASRNYFETKGFPSEEEYIPYFECGVGIHIWKNYPKLKPEEIEE